MPSLRCLALALLFPLAARASLILGPEVAISSPAYGSTAGRQAPAAIAAGAAEFLVLWTDSTPGREGLYATRIDDRGELAPAAGLPIRTGGVPSGVSVCWTGSSYLVTWTDPRANGVMIAALNPDGSFLTQPRVLIGPALTYAKALAWNGSEAMLACLWGSGGMGTVKATLLDAAGNVQSSGIDITGLTVTDSLWIVPFRRTFAVFWSGNARPTPTSPVLPGVIARRFDDSGQAIDAEPVLILSAIGRFGIATGSNGYGLAVMVGQPQDTAKLRRFRIDPDSLRATELPAIATTGYAADVLWNGSEFVAYWMSYSSSSYAFHKSAFESAVVDTIASDAYLSIDPLLAWNGSTYLAVWMNGPGINTGEGDVAALLLARDGTTALSSQIAVNSDSAPVSQMYPHIAHAGTTSYVVWSEKTSDMTVNLLGVRVATDGRWLDPKPSLIARKAGIGQVVSAGSAFLVVWPHEDENGPGLYMSRVAPDGIVSEPKRIAAGYTMSVASNGTTALVGFAMNGIRALRIDDQGEVLDPVPFVITERYEFLSSLTSNGTDFLAVWNEGSDYWQFPSPDRVDVYAARVFASGIADVPIPVAVGPKNQFGGIAASNGRDYVVAFYVDGQLATKQILREGRLAGSTPDDDGHVIDLLAGAASIAPLGAGYVVAFESYSTDRVSLHLIETAEDGRPVPDTDLLVATTPRYFSLWPAVTSFGFAIQFVYAHFIEIDENTMRVFVRTARLAAGRRRLATH
jgi:hypothetical protein